MAGSKSIFGISRGKKEEFSGEALPMDLAREIMSDYVALALHEHNVKHPGAASHLLATIDSIKSFSLAGSSVDSLVEFESNLYRGSNAITSNFIRNGIAFFFSHVCSLVGEDGVTTLIDDICFGIRLSATQIDPTVKRVQIDEDDKDINEMIAHIKNQRRLVFYEVLKHTYVEVNVIVESGDQKNAT